MGINRGHTNHFAGPNGKTKYAFQNDFRVSPRGVRLAEIAMRGSRQVVIVDGVAGEPYDQIYFAVDLGSENLSAYAVNFSSDGSRFAYAARKGDEFVVVLDGKEFFRSTVPSSENFWLRTPFFWESGDRLVWVTATQNRRVCNMAVDGVVGPPSDSDPRLLQIEFSGDGSRYAYTSRHSSDGSSDELVVDGKIAPYPGRLPKFTADGKSVVTTRFVKGRATAVDVDGEPVYIGGSVGPIQMASEGRTFVFVAAGKSGSPMLHANGNEIPGTEGALAAFVSPDGKRHAAVCRTRSGARVAVLDGRRGPEYAYLNVNPAAYGFGPSPGFSADSRQFAYVAYNNAYFVVTNDEESAPLRSREEPRLLFSERDGLDGFVCDPRPYGEKPFWRIDGKDLPVSDWPIHVVRSADGSRFAYSISNVAGRDEAGLYLGGVWAAEIRLSGSLTPARGSRRNIPCDFELSDNGNHYAANAYDSRWYNRGLYVDGQLVGKSANDAFLRVAFSPDNRHVTWVAVEGSEPESYRYALYLDGERIVSFDRNDPYSRFLLEVPGTWDIDGDGVITFLAVNEGKIVRYVVRPDAESSVSTMLAKARSASARNP